VSLPSTRCPWAGNDPLYVAYHDQEWGVPVHNDRTLFEFLLPEGAQAGLSWITILRKRDAYRRAFAGFDPAAVADFDADKIATRSRCVALSEVRCTFWRRRPTLTRRCNPLQKVGCTEKREGATHFRKWDAPR
jgi:hypothetical protein